MGLGLIGVVTAQVLVSIVEGFAINAHKMEPAGLKTDLLHRLGFPFGVLGPPTALFLVIGLLLICLPTLLGQEITPFQDLLISVGLIAVVVLALIISAGSLLAVRNSLHDYRAQPTPVPVPPYARLGFVSFLLGTLGTTAAALFGALSAIGSRRRRR